MREKVGNFIKIRHKTGIFFSVHSSMMKVTVWVKTAGKFDYERVVVKWTMNACWWIDYEREWELLELLLPSMMMIIIITWKKQE